MRRIPLLSGEPHFRQRTSLDGSEYAFTFRWNGREGRWYFSIADANGDDVLVGLKLVANFPLLYRFRGVNGVPPGELTLVDARSISLEPTLDDLGDFALTYEEAST